jgi:hypothetical protein
MMAQAALDFDQSTLQAFFTPLSAPDRQKGLSDVINASIQNYVFEPGEPDRGLVQMNWNQSDDALTVNRITPHERTFGVLSTERPPTETETKTLKIPLVGGSEKLDLKSFSIMQKRALSEDRAHAIISANAWSKTSYSTNR